MSVGSLCTTPDFKIPKFKLRCGDQKALQFIQSRSRPFFWELNNASTLNHLCSCTFD
ncbi:hypothetical protein T12_13154 [Trichinella patagoniensis]|uniref:Uncharacterized protein n=1 Tax=Trichinella patagoniensis TaxID=990121 RepID=A0A0V0XH19_9BILA|nr:hypothetical protein T12_13154 [Trichinella patagoniensis]